VPSDEPFIDEQSRIVVGVDGSDQSKLGLRWAARIASNTGASIDAVIAWQYPVAYGLGPIPGNWSPADDAKSVLFSSVKDVYGTDHPAGVRLQVLEGHPARVLIDASEGAQMLIVGSRGHGGFPGLHLGSIGAACAEHASCAVLVIR
jgi:nucleotide-binding universal stress UspA family protein